MIPYPDIDPVALSVGPFDLPMVGLMHLRVHWYGIMYLIGFAGGWLLARWRAKRPGSGWEAKDVDDLIFFTALGVIIGGRLGWCLVYGLHDVMADPLFLFKIWKGGMSFHGGLVGVLAAATLFARLRRRAIGDVFDFVAPLPGVGLFAGRIGNFINSELWGKPTDVPWGFAVNGEVLHASQLYEAVLEGLVLFVVLWVFTLKPRPRWSASGLFLLLYGLFRFLVEFVRVPDENMGYIAFGWLTTGQLLSAPMFVAGLAMMIYAYKRKVFAPNEAPVSAPRETGAR